MIRVSRGPEPEALRAERRRRLCQAILARRSGKDIEFSGYEVAKDALVSALNHKCVFCEKDLRKEGNPVEHFRPKAFVRDEEEAEDRSRYWWLAWTWENLLFACFRCNTLFKKNQFPLEAGTEPLPERSVDLDLEHPLLIDPARVDPREHIRFRWSEARRRWLPEAVAGSRMGAKTIQVLGLDEDDAPQRHLEHHVEPWLEPLEEQVRGGHPEVVRATWKRLTRALFAPGEREAGHLGRRTAHPGAPRAPPAVTHFQGPSRDGSAAGGAPTPRSCAWGLRGLGGRERRVG